MKLWAILGIWITHVGKNHIPPPQNKEHANMAIIGKPRNLKEDIQPSDVSEWELATQAEYQSFIANGTWEITPLPKGRKAVKWKWVFCMKKECCGL